MMPPKRHADLFVEIDKVFSSDSLLIQPDEQGFLGDDGLFYSREEAKEIIDKKQQRIINNHHPTQLFSEDLW